MSLRVLVLSLLLLLPSVAHAVTRYVDGGIATCSTYNTATRTCTGGSASAYTTVQQGLAALNPSDRLEIRSGTYTVSGIYGNSAAQDYGGGATSWATATVITNYPGETITIDNSNGGFNIDSAVQGSAGASYIIFEGQTRPQFIIDGHDTLTQAIRVNNSANHIRIKRLTIKDQGYVGGVGSGTSTGTGTQHCTQKPSFIEILDNEFVGNGSPGAGSGSHGLYPTCSSDWLVDSNHFINNEVYGIHFNQGDAGADNPVGMLAHIRDVISNNVIEGRRSTGTSTSACLWINRSQDEIVYRNVCLGLGAGEKKHNHGFAFGDNNTNLLVLNNTIYDVLDNGIQFTGSAGSNIITAKNNIFDDVPDPFDLGCAPTCSPVTNITVAGNLCPFLDTTFGGAAPCPVVTATPGFVAVGTDFHLAAGSQAINAGVVQSGYSFSGSAPDIGAYETVPPGYLTDMAVHVETTLPSLPAANSTAFDPVFGAQIMRVTDRSDASHCGTTYSNSSHMNSNSTRIWSLCTGSVMRIWDFNATTMQISNERMQANKVSGARELGAQWHTTDPNKYFLLGDTSLYEVTIPASGTTYTNTLLRNFASDIGGVVGVTYLEQMSRSANNDVFSFHYYRNGIVTGYIVYKRSTNTILLHVTGGAINEVEIDKSGRYLATRIGTTTTVWDLQPVPPVQTSVTNQPFTHRAMGNGIVVSDCSGTQSICKRNLATPNTVVNLTANGTWAYGTQSDHFSLSSTSDAWFLGCRYHLTAGGVTAAFNNECMLIATDGSQNVRRLVHNHSNIYNNNNDYPAQPKGALSFDGNFIAFTSNWEASSANTLVTDQYIARTSSGGVLPPTDVTPPSPPTNIIISFLWDLLFMWDVRKAG